MDDYNQLVDLAWVELLWRGYLPEQFSHKEGVKVLPKAMAVRHQAFAAPFNEEAFKQCWDARRDAIRQLRY